MCKIDVFFTFHNVSIKSGLPTLEVFRENALHSTMYLLNRLTGLTADTSYTFTFHNVSIKSCSGLQAPSKQLYFTFHNVSIKSILRPLVYRCLFTLHSTMYLLNPRPLQPL